MAGSRDRGRTRSVHSEKRKAPHKGSGKGQRRVAPSCTGVSGGISEEALCATLDTGRTGAVLLQESLSTGVPPAEVAWPSGGGSLSPG